MRRAVLAAFLVFSMIEIVGIAILRFAISGSESEPVAWISLLSTALAGGGATYAAMYTHARHQNERSRMKQELESSWRDAYAAALRLALEEPDDGLHWEQLCSVAERNPNYAPDAALAIASAIRKVSFETSWATGEDVDKVAAAQRHPKVENLLESLRRTISSIESISGDLTIDLSRIFFSGKITLDEGWILPAGIRIRFCESEFERGLKICGRDTKPVQISGELDFSTCGFEKIHIENVRFGKSGSLKFLEAKFAGAGSLEIDSLNADTSDLKGTGWQLTFSGEAKVSIGSLTKSTVFVTQIGSEAFSMVSTRGSIDIVESRLKVVLDKDVLPSTTGKVHVTNGSSVQIVPQFHFDEELSDQDWVCSSDSTISIGNMSSSDGSGERVRYEYS